MHNLLHDEKDIDSIFFYAINGNINYLTLFYTANNIKYKIDYKDVNFKETVDRIIKVYNILKDERNIKLVGNLTKDIIEGKIRIDNKTFNNTLINTSNFDYETMYSYIKLIIEHTLKLLNINWDVYLGDESFSYRRNNVDYRYIIPITFYKNNNNYKLKYKLIKDYKEYIFDCDINIFSKSIIVNIKNKEYNGEIIFDRLNIINSIIFKNKDSNIVYSNYFENDLLDSDIKKIKQVFDMINIDYEINGIKTIDNNYILYNKKDKYEYYMHLNISDNSIRVNLKQLKKYNKDKIDFKVEEEHFDYLILKYNGNYVLVQQKYLLSNNSNYEYKKNINKSKYYLLKTNNACGKLIDIEIEKHIEINDKLDSLDDIKKLTLKKVD